MVLLGGNGGSWEGAVYLELGAGLGRISGGHLFQPLLKAAIREGISRLYPIGSWSLPGVDMLVPAAPLPPLTGKTSAQSGPSNPAGAAGRLHSIANEVLYFLFAFPYECIFVSVVDTATLCCSRYKFVTSFCFQGSLAGLNHQKYHIF